MPAWSGEVLLCSPLKEIMSQTPVLREQEPCIPMSPLYEAAPVWLEGDIEMVWFESTPGFGYFVSGTEPCEQHYPLSKTCVL